jgi:methionine biosynthesis protein MetW
MNLTLRPDLQVIADLVPAGARVLDIGCGDGTLLAWLRAHKGVDGRGMEIDQKSAQLAIARGIPVIQGDIESEVMDYPTSGYDFVILSQTLQAMRAPKTMLEHVCRVGTQAIVSVPNFGHWKNRLYLALRGKMPVTKTLNYEWYDTPNIHFCTITDFVILCEEIGARIEQRIMVDDAGHRAGFRGRGVWANLIGQQGVFLLSRQR